MNPGSFDKPWDIATAFNHPRELKPDDTLWIRGGRYFGTAIANQNTISGFLCSINGQKDHPIIIRAYPGERAILDGGNRPHPVAADPNLDSYTLGITGSHLWFWGLEICNSNSSSRSDSTAGFRWRVRGIVSTGSSLRFINNMFYDLGNGIEAFSACETCEYYGNIVFNNGWSHLGVRGHGEGMYAQNETPFKIIKDNIFFNQFDNGLIIYGTSQSSINNFKIIGNILFGNGTPNDDPNGWGFLFGKNNQNSGPGANYEITQNYLYNNFDYQRSNNMDLAYQSGLSDVLLINNYSVGRNALKYNIPIQKLTANSNTFIGEVNQIAYAQVNNGLNEIRSAQNTPTSNIVFRRPNEYEAGRAHIVIFNWEDIKFESVDLNNLGLRDGDEFEILDVQNILGDPIHVGTYDPKNPSVLLPLDLKLVTQAIGEGVPRETVHTPSLFNTFLLRKRNPITSVSETPHNKDLLIKNISYLEDGIIIEINMELPAFLRVYNMMGNMVHSNEIHTSLFKIHKNIFNPGVYFLELNCASKKETVRIIF